MIEQAVIIAGGQGTRMKNILNTKPKLLVDIQGTSLLNLQLNYLKKNGIKKVHFCLGYGSEQIIEQLKYIDLEYSFLVEDKPLGTYGALYNSKNYLLEEFFVLYGDIVTNYDIQKGYKEFKKLKSDFHLVLRFTNHPSDSDIVQIENHKVVSIDRSENLVFPYLPIGNTALLFSNKNALVESSSSTPQDIFKNYIKDNIKILNITGSLTSDYVRDIGTESRYKTEIVDIDLKLSKPYNVAFIDRDGTLIENQGDENNLSKLNFKKEFIEVLSYLQSNHFKVYMLTNQPGIAKGFFTLEDVNKFNALIQHKLIELGLKPLDNIFICPHHEEKGFENEVQELKIKCYCRKPKPGLLERAVKNHQIDISRSVYFGDTLADYNLSLTKNIPFYLIRSELTEIETFNSLNVDYYLKSEDLINSLKNLFTNSK